MPSSGRTVTIEKTCIICMDSTRIELDLDRYNRWISGEFAQNVWPEWTAGQRELLISGTHEVCFDNVFGTDE